MGELEQILRTAQDILVFAALIIGALQCFFGYKLFRVMTAIIGFCVGGIIGVVVGASMAGESGAILGLLVLGILGAILAYFLYQLGVFVICFGAGAIVGLMLSMMMGDHVEPALAAICGLVLGILGVILTKPVIILSTGVGGGMLMGFGLGMLFNESSTGTLLGLVLSAIGIFLQFYLDKKKGGGTSNAVPASGSSASAKPRQPGTPLSFGAVKALTKSDLTSRQAIYGLLVWGALGFGCAIPLFIALIIIGFLMGGCANGAGIEYYTFGREDIQNRRVYIGAAIGGGIGLLIGTVDHSRGLGVIILMILLFGKYGAVIGYLLEMRQHYKAAHGAVTPAPLSGVASPAPQTSAVTGDALVSSNDRLWTQGLPIVITGMSISPAKEDPCLVSLSLTFQNIGEQSVVGVYLGVNCRNLLNQELKPVEKLTIQDFVLEPGKSWTYAYPHALPDGDTRKVELVARHVVMADGSTWDCDEGSTLTVLESQPSLQIEDHLRQQFFLDCNELIKGGTIETIFRYQPQAFEGHWNCACGQINLGEVCVTCGIGRTDLFERIDRERLQKHYDLRQEEELQRTEAQRQLETERRLKIEAQKQAVKDAATSAGSWVKETWIQQIYPFAEKAISNAREKFVAFLKMLTDKLDKRT